jgi:hypothetical protein
MPDQFGRPFIEDADRQRVREAFSAIPKNKRAALLLIADTDTKAVRAHLAANINGTWKVAAGGGWIVSEKRPSGWIAVEAAW